MEASMADKPTVPGVVFDLFEEAHKRGYLDNLLNIFRKKHRILVLGHSGAGKSQFLKSLESALPETISALNRTQFVENKKILLNKKPFVFRDTPGQELHRPRRIEAVREEMRGGLSGIINVVSYGYHEGAGEKSIAIDPAGTIRPEFLARQRASEIELLSEWTGLLGDRVTTNWLITVVTKADLWWHKKEEVLGHYSSGLYLDSLGDARSLQPIVLPYSSVFHKFYGEGNLSGTFDDNDRISLRNDLIKNLISAVSHNKHV
jgi:energy-coupling factor transporter ATP-binding protein EcfA2